MDKDTSFKIIFWILLILACGTGIFFYFSPKTDEGVTRYDTFRDRAFRKGLLNEEALAESLKSAETAREKARLEIKFAFGQKNNGDPVGAITTLKRVVSNESYENVDKAYAIESMGRIYFSDSDPLVFNAIFSGEPYTGFREDNARLSLRKLHEYASSFYPSAIAELRIAEWYSDEVIRTQGLPLSDVEKNEIIQSLTPIIKEKFENAEADITRQVTWPNPSYERIAYAITIEAVTLANLTLAGTPNFFDFAIDPEGTFEEAIGAANQGNIESQAEWASYHYAIFLAKAFGEDRKEDIQRLIGRTYTGPGIEKTMTPHLKNQKDAVSQGHDDILLLASIDEGYKHYLTSIGWKF
jgi:hypothetical protein